VKVTASSTVINPRALRGLEQALYILESLCEGEPENKIIEKFQGDEQLVTMWVSFLKHNHWLEFDTVTHKYVLTKKGLEWAIGKTAR